MKKTYICITYNIDDNRKQGYLVLLHKGSKYNLLKREKVELLKGEKSPNAYTKDANDYYAKEKTDNKVQDTLVVDSGGKDSLEIYKPTIEDYKFKTQFSKSFRKISH